MLALSEKSVSLLIDGKEVDLYSEESFQYISDLWLKVGWANKYCYKFTWLGRPILQLPEDMLKIQELIFTLKPECIIETGVAHGGSLIFYASILKMMGIEGKVIGVELDLKEDVKLAIEDHPMSDCISLIKGDAIDPNIVTQVDKIRKHGVRTLVILDSCHWRDHVLDELRMYSHFVDIGSYILATDGIIKDFADVKESPTLLKLRPDGIGKDFSWNNPQESVKIFLEENDDFVLEKVPPLFNDSFLESDVTYWPNAFLKRIK